MSDNANVASASIFLVILVFVAASGATWVAGVELSKSTDELDRRLGFGDAIGGMVLLAIAGNETEDLISHFVGRLSFALCQHRCFDSSEVLSGPVSDQGVCRCRRKQPLKQARVLDTVSGRLNPCTGEG